MKIPCEECLTLAICRQRDWIRCSIAGEYCLRDIEVGSAPVERIAEIKEILNKERWSFEGNHPWLLLYNGIHYKGMYEGKHK